MFPKKTVDLIILSILNDNPDGSSGYSLVMKMKKIFSMAKISPGTIYPKLKKLTDLGDILEENKLYKISSQGKQRLQETTPKIIDDTLEFMPKLYKFLMNKLPFELRMDYFSDIPSCFNFATVNDKDETLFSDESVCSSNISNSLRNLKIFRVKLLSSREKTKKRMEARLNSIDSKLKEIDKKIEECLQEKKTWKKIPIEEVD